MKFRLFTASLPLMLLVLAPPAWSQPAANFSGHWKGVIHVPDKDLEMHVDLAKNDKGEWMGTIDIPPQNLKGFPLSNLAVTGNSVAFAMKGVPGEPVFNGKIEGQSISGNFKQGEVSLTFDLKHSGDARFETPAKSTPITKEMEGTWEGALNAGGTTLRLVLKLANQGDGAAGTMVSLDQGGAEIPITTITQKDSSLKFEIKTINATYAGDLKEGALVGQWTQGPSTFPLTFKRPAQKEDKK
jgi:hypothetical protein